MYTEMIENATSLRAWKIEAWNMYEDCDLYNKSVKVTMQATRKYDLFH